MIKNVVHPGYVRSMNDGDVHYITGSMLTKLYGLNPRETIIIDPCDRYQQHGRELPDDVEHYYPRQDGNYGTRK